MNRIKDVCDELCRPYEYARGNVLLAFLVHLGPRRTAVFFFFFVALTSSLLRIFISPVTPAKQTTTYLP